MHWTAAHTAGKCKADASVTVDGRISPARVAPERRERGIAESHRLRLERRERGRSAGTGGSEHGAEGLADPLEHRHRVTNPLDS